MTEEYARKARQQSRDYAVLSYGLRYKIKDGYLEDEEQKQPQTSDVEDAYNMEAPHPQLQHKVEAVSVTLIRYYIKLRKITG
jgi:hypothetical protein